MRHTSARKPSKSKWSLILDTVTHTIAFKKQPFTTTDPFIIIRIHTTKSSLHTTKRYAKGLIFGPVDKNLNELWFCCPVLYRKAWDKTYAQTSDYQRIYPKIAKKTRGATTAYELEVTDNEGTAKDIVQLWERHYKKQGWDKLATYNKKGDFNRPYILFKSKNITDHEIRQTKNGMFGDNRISLLRQPGSGVMPHAAR